MAKFINSTYTPNPCFGTTPIEVELKVDQNGQYFHQPILQRRNLPPKKNFELKTLLDAKVDLERVNCKIFQVKQLDLTPPPETETITTGVENAE